MESGSGGNIGKKRGCSVKITKIGGVKKARDAMERSIKPC